MVPGTIIYPDSPARRIEILWADQGQRKRPVQFKIKGRSTVWKTEKGITLGTTLKEVERLNDRPFILAGFGWDYGGMTLHSNGGRVKELGRNHNVPRPK